MVTKLIVVAGETNEREVNLSPPTVIGRSRQADITIAHPLVSRRHCEIVVGDDDKLVVRDLGSLNGTFIGKTRIEGEAVLESGELLTVGAITFRASYGDADQVDAEAATTAPDAENEDVLDFVLDEAEAEVAPAEVEAAAKPETTAEPKATTPVEVEETLDFEVDEDETVEPKKSEAKVEAKPAESGDADDDGFDLAWLEDEN